MPFDIFQVQPQNELLTEIERCNTFTQYYGLTLTKQEILELIQTRNRALKNNGRIEIGNSIIPDFIYAFCDSPYISKENYMETLEELVEIFYAFKNETEDRLSDAQLIQKMKNDFNGSCAGSIELLANRELENLVQQLRGIKEEAFEEEQEDE